MAGWVRVSEMPHRTNPFSHRWAPTCDSSFPARIGDVFGQQDFHDSLLERKRKLDGLKEEPIGNGGGRTRPKPPSQEQLRPQSVKPSTSSGPSTTLSGFPPNKVDVCGQSSQGQGHPTVKSGQEVKRIINIPVVCNDDAKERSAVKCTVVPEEGTKKSRRALSTRRAAVLVQSWYRGHLVRRTEPLVQLAKIREVKSKLRELQSQLSDAYFIEQARRDHKARVRLTESVMDLLFRLDAIQGAHPFVREIRKAATREVVGCQNAIDSLLSVKDSARGKTTEDMLIDGIESDEDTTMEIQETETPVNNLNSTIFYAGVEMQASNEGERRISVPEEILVHDETDVNTISDSPQAIIEPDPDQTSDGSGGDGKLLTALKIKSKAESGTGPVKLESLQDKEGHNCIAKDAETEAGPNLDRNVGEWFKQLEEAHTLPTQSDHDMLQATTDNDALRDEQDFALNLTEVPCHHSTVDPEEQRQHGVGDADPEDFHSECTSETLEERSRRECDEEVKKGPREERKSSQDEEINDATSDLSNGLTVNGNTKPIHPAEEQSYFSKDFSSVSSPRSPLDFGRNEDLSSMAHPVTTIIGAASKLEGVLSEKQFKEQLTKLSEENRALKSLLVGLLKWNQLQASTMQEVNQRLERLESRLSNCSNKQKGSRRKICSRRKL